MEDDLLKQGGEGGEELLRREQEVKPGSTAVEAPDAGTSVFEEFEQLKKGLQGPLTKLAEMAPGLARNLTRPPAVEDVPGLGSAPPKKVDFTHLATGPIRAATTPTPSSGIPKILHGGSIKVELVDYHPKNAPSVTVKVATLNITKYPGIVDMAGKLVGTIENCLSLLRSNKVLDGATKLSEKKSGEVLPTADLRADEGMNFRANLERILNSDKTTVLPTLFAKALKENGVVTLGKEVKGAMELAKATVNVNATLKTFSDGIKKILGELITPDSAGDIKKTLMGMQQQLALSYGDRDATTSLLPSTKERKI